MPTMRLMRLRYLGDSIRYYVSEDSSFRRVTYIYLFYDKWTTFNKPGRQIYMFSKPFPTHFVPSHCLCPFDGDNPVLLDSIDPLDSTRLPGLHRWTPSSPCTTQRRRVRRVLRSFVEYIGYNTATSSPPSSRLTPAVFLESPTLLAGN